MQEDVVTDVFEGISFHGVLSYCTQVSSRSKVVLHSSEFRMTSTQRKKLGQMFLLMTSVSDAIIYFLSRSVKNQGLGILSKRTCHECEKERRMSSHLLFFAGLPDDPAVRLAPPLLLQHAVHLQRVAVLLRVLAHSQAEVRLSHDLLVLGAAFVVFVVIICRHWSRGPVVPCVRSLAVAAVVNGVIWGGRAFKSCHLTSLNRQNHKMRKLWNCSCDLLFHSKIL